MEIRPSQSQMCFLDSFLETYLSKVKMDIYKCPFFKNSQQFQIFITKIRRYNKTT
jgi:hypothetical protein